MGKRKRGTFPLQALVGLKDTIKFRLWRGRRAPDAKENGPKTRRNTPDCFKFQIVFSCGCRSKRHALGCYDTLGTDKIIRCYAVLPDLL
jgi:hypothetical protein